MGVLIDGISAETFHATLMSKKIMPAKVAIIQDWMRSSVNPLVYAKKETYKEITLTFLVEDADGESCLTDISNLSRALEQCTLKFTEEKYYYDAWTYSDAEPTLINPKTYQYDITLNAAFAYLPAINFTLVGQAGTITAQGNLPSPAIVTLTPTQNIGAVTLTGLTRRPVVVKNVHAGAPVIIDAEKCIVTEADYENSIADAQGAGKWIFRKYSMVSIANPDDTDIHMLPTKATIPADETYRQQLVSDGVDLIRNSGYDYLGYLKTAVQVSAAKTVTLHLCHDDGCSVYLNGAQIYGKDYHAVTEDGTGPVTVALSLSAGWNTIEIIWIQHYGPDGIYSVNPVLGTQVDALNCAHAQSSASGGLINKFSDTDMWSFPVLQPGSNPISIDSTVCGVKIEYKPKFM